MEEICVLCMVDGMGFFSPCFISRKNGGFGKWLASSSKGFGDVCVVFVKEWLKIWFILLTCSCSLLDL